MCFFTVLCSCNVRTLVYSIEYISLDDKRKIHSLNMKTYEKHVRACLSTILNNKHVTVISVQKKFTEYLNFKRVETLE